MISLLDGLGAREQTAVDRIHNWSRRDHASVKVAAVEALNGVLAARHLIELEVDVTLRVGIQSDVHHMPILLLSLLANLLLKFLDPILALLPIDAC